MFRLMSMKKTINEKCYLIKYIGEIDIFLALTWKKNSKSVPLNFYDF